MNDFQDLVLKTVSEQDNPLIYLGLVEKHGATVLKELDESCCYQLYSMYGAEICEVLDSYTEFLPTAFTIQYAVQEAWVVTCCQLIDDYYLTA